MASTKMATVEVTCNTRRAKASIKEYERLASEAMENLAKLTAVVNEQQKQGIKITKEQAAEMKKLEDDIKTYTSAQQRGIDDLRKAKDVLNDLANSSIKEVNKAIRDMTKSMNGMRDINGIRKTQADIEKLRQTLNDKLKPTVNEIMKDFKNLNTLSLDKLNQNMETLRQKWASMSEQERMGINGQDLQRAISSYEAQAAVVRYGAAGTSDLSNMGLEKLQAERSRLSAAYNATEGSMLHKGVSQEYLSRLQAVNQAIKNITESEREAARAAKEADEEAQRRIEFAQQGQRTHQTLANMEKANYEDLEAALKHLQEQYKTYASGDVKHIQRNLAAQDQLKQKMKEMQPLLLTEQELSDRVNNKKKYSIVQLQQAYDQLKAKLSNLAIGETETIEKTQKQMKSLQKEISKAKGELTGFAKLWNTALKNIGAYMGVFAAFGYAKNKIMEVAKGSLALSDAMAQVQKVTGLSKQEVDELNNSFAKLDTRTTINQLNDLAFSAGKMGLGKYGLGGIEGFVKATNKLQVALGDDLGNSVEEAITPLAKLAENMGLIQKMGVEKSMMAIGSSINELSQTTTATGRNIVDFTRRIQPTAQMLGLTVDQVLALGSASDAFGVSAEVSATAFTKFLASYRTNTEAIEKNLGIAKGTLDDFYNNGQTMEGLLLIFQRMHDIGDIRVLAPIFKDLGSEGSRMFETFGAFSKNIDQLRDHVLTSELAFDEATSVTREYNLVQDTAAGILERANNIWEKAFVNPEGVDMVKQLTIEWYNLSKELTNSATWIDYVQGLMKSMVFVVETLIKLLPTLVKAMFFYGAAQAIRKIYIQFTMLNTAMATAATTAGKLSAFMKSNIWVLAGTAILFAVSAIYDMATASSKAKKEADAMGDALKNASDDGEKASAKERAELKRLYDATQDQKKAIEERTKAALELKRKYPDYFSDLTTEQILAGKAAKAYQNLAQQILNAAKARAMEKKIEQLQEENINLEDDNRKREQWRDDNQKRYEEEKAKIDSAVNQQNRMETAGSSPVGGKMGYAHASNAGDKQLVSEYQANDQAISDNSDKIKENNAVMERLSEEVSKIKPNSTNSPDMPTFPPNGTDDGDTGGNTAKAPEWMVKEKENAEKSTKAVIGSIEEFYRLQEAAANEMAANGQLKGADFDMLVKHIQDRKDKMLLEARRAIVGDPNEFEKERKTLQSDMVKRDDAVSMAAMKRIQEADPAKKGAVLRKYDGSDAVYGLDSNAWLNDIRKNAAQNELNIQRRQAAVQTEIDKLLLQYQYVEQAQRDFGDKLVKMGLITDGYQKVVQQLADGTEVVVNTKDVQKLADKTVKMDTQRMYGVDTNDALELRNMVDALMHTVDEDGNKIRESFASMFPNLDEWLANPEQYKEQMQAFYKTLIDMDTDYYKALKQNYEQEKREFDERWQAMGWTDQEKRENTAFETQDSLRKISGQGENFGQTYGFADTIADDPEIARIKNRMEWRAKELEDLQNRNASEELIMQKQNEMLKEAASLAEKVSQEIADRISKVQTLSEPLNSFGEEVGQMLGEQWQGISREGKLSFGQMAKNMGIEYAKLTLKMASENLMKKLQQGLFYKQMEMQEMQHQVNLTNIAIQGATARQQAQAGIGQLGLVTKSAQDAAEIGAEGGKATIMTMFGISEGASKIIAALGFWGIPLIGVITSILMGLLNSAKSTASQESSSMASSSAATPKTKLVSGMLTYDKGNVQSYVGTDGRVYRATPDAAPKTGLVRQPIATTVQGNPALVAERGPEIVVGRRATANIMRFNPELVNILASYDRRHSAPRLRTYDEGTDVQYAAIPSQPQSEQDNAQLAAALIEMTAMMQALAQTNAQLSSAVTTMSQRGVKAVINKYGTGGLIDEVKSGLKFDARYNR